MFGKKTKKDDFPYVDTLKCDYTSQEVSKLASLSSYNLVEGLKNVGFDIEQVEAGNLSVIIGQKEARVPKHSAAQS